MISVEEALEFVSRHTPCNSAVEIGLSDALGLILADDVTSDVDSPPHDKAMVDGYAVVSDDLADGSAVLTVLEEVTAGEVPTLRVASGSATRIMTGAPVPAGSDAVVMIERTQLVEDKDAGPQRVRISDAPTTAGQHILPQGSVMRCGEVVLEKGSEVRSAETGLLAEVGRTKVRVFERPRVAILATGNELVAPGDTPGPGQIRNSNGPMLAAAIRRRGATPIELAIGRDEPAELERLIAQGLEADMLLISGGVSAGVLDLVPQVLANAGVEQVFHKVRLKPGKPLWFGTKAADPAAKIVFGLPGNPVSGLVCFELFVRAAIDRLIGRPSSGLPTMWASLSTEHSGRGDRPTWWPARLCLTGGEPKVEPLAWQGSADLRTFAQANALIHFPPGERTYSAGEPIEVLPL